MNRQFRLLLCLLFLTCLLPLALTPPVTAEPATADETSATLVPLPKSCGGGLPPGEDIPACCLFGYVFIDGEAVAGAKVTVTSPKGRTEDWTGKGPDSNQPYFRLSLSDAPLSVTPGDTITIQVEYSSHQRTVTHVVLNGAQQVDVVLPRNQADDYVYSRQLWSQPAPGEFSSIFGIAVDETETVYAADSEGSRIQVFSGDGQFLRQWGTLGSQPGQMSNPNAIAIDKQGNVYVTDEDNERVQKFSNTGTWLGAWGSKGSGPGQFRGPRGIAVDTANSIYVVDKDNHRIQKFTAAGTLLDTWGQRGSANGLFEEPRGIAIDGNNNIYIADYGNHRIQKFTTDGTWVATLGAQGSAPSQFIYPYGVAVDQAGVLYVADVDNHRIQRFAPDGTWLGEWGGAGAGNGQFREPRMLAVGPSGNVYVTDSAANTVQKFTPGGAFLKRWGKSGGDVAAFRAPRGVLLSEDALFVVDTGYNRIKKLRRDGSVLAVWGEYGQGNGQFDGPRAIALSPDGTVYVADGGNHRIQKFTQAGVWLDTYGGLGTAPGQFNEPRGIAIDADGTIYVADTKNHRVQKFSPTFTWLGMWGEIGEGPGQFNVPVGIAIDSKSMVYIADSVNDRVQKFSASGVWASTLGRSGSKNGQFNVPQTIAVDSSDNLYVLETNNQRLQKFSSTGAWRATWGTEGSGDGELRYPVGIAVDTNGEVYVSDKDNYRIVVFRPMANTQPVATIVAAEPRSVAQGQPVRLQAMGSDSDSTLALATYEWFLNESSSPFAQTPTATLATASLAPGRHTITLRVRDTEGERSAPQSVTIDVSPSTPAQTVTWTFLLYLDGDAPNIAPYLNRTSPLGALYRLERAMPNARVTVAALYDGPVPGGGDSFRYLIRPDGSFTQEHLNEVNMGDPTTLVDFVRWGQQMAPSDHYYLAIADHADAISGIAWDSTTSRTERLTNTEIRQSLVAITENGARPIDVLHFDGCLMGLVESAYQVRGLARYLVASENIGWSAFAYERYRAAVGARTTPRDLAIAIADQYAEVVGSRGYPYTISAIDLEQIDALARATDSLAEALINFGLERAENWSGLNALRAQVQKLDSSANYLLQNDDEYVDLTHLAQLLKGGVQNGEVQRTADALLARIPSVILRAHAASGELARVTGVPGSGYDLSKTAGLGIYYPPRASAKTYQVYAQGELTFAVDTRWDEFLAMELAGLPFDQSEPVPSAVEPLPLPPLPEHRVYLPALSR